MVSFDVTDEEVLEMQVLQEAYPEKLSQAEIDRRVNDRIKSIGDKAHAVELAHAYMSKKPTLN